MKELTKSEVVRIKDLDSKIKNKCRFIWLEDSLAIKSKKSDSVTICVGDSIVKVDIPGKVLCQYCNDVINCGSKGRVAIIDHLKSGKHASKVDHRQSNYTLGAQFPRKMLLLLFLHHHPNSSILLKISIHLLPPNSSPLLVALQI